MLSNKYFKICSLIFLSYFLHTETFGKSTSTNFEYDSFDLLDNKGFSKISKSASKKDKLTNKKNSKTVKIGNISFEYEGKIACMIAQAIEDNNLNQIQELIDQNPQIQNNTELLTTFMNMAGLYNYIDIAKKFINIGADVNGKIMLGNNKPIIYAVLSNNLDFLSLLVQNGANPNEKGKNKTTPLMHACKKNYIKIVEFLLENRADPRSQDSELCTPLNYALNYAIMNNNYEVVELIQQKLSEKHDLQEVYIQEKPEIIIPILKNKYLKIAKNTMIIGILSYLGYKSLTLETKIS